MSIFAQYTKQAKAARMSAAVTSEADPLAPLPEEEVVVPETDVEVVPEVAVEEPVVDAPAAPVDQFAQARERLNLNNHNLIRARSVVSQEEELAEPIVDEVPAETDVVEAPVDAIPEGGELPEEPALDVTAEEEIDLGEDDVVETPVVEDEEVIPAVVEAEEVVVETPSVEEAPEVVVEEPVVEEPAAEVIPETDEAEEDTDMEDDIAESEIASDEAEIEEMEAEMRMLSQSMIAIESYGMNPSAAGILQATGLLNGTALETMALESFNYVDGKDVESAVALEALGDKVKETAARWSAKIMSVVSSVGDKTMSVIKSVWDKLTSVTSKLASATWDKAQTAGKMVKAHPYKTVIAVVGAIAAVAGIMIYTGTGLPAMGAKPAAVAAYLKGFADKVTAINNPFGGVTAKVVEASGKVSVQVTKGAVAAKAVAMDSLGWTASMVKNAGGQLARAWDATQKGAAAFGARATKVGASIKSGAKFIEDGVGATSLIVRAKVGKAVGSAKAGAIAAGAYGLVVTNAIWSTAVSIAKLLYGIVLKGLRAIAATFGALSSAVGVKAAAA